MTRYDAGAQFERDVRAHLQLEGYDVVRSAGSKTKIDLVAIKPSSILLIQAKRDGKISPAERSDLLRVADAAMATALVAYKHPKAGISFWRLLGTGSQDRVPWSADEVAEVTP